MEIILPMQTEKNINLSLEKASAVGKKVFSSVISRYLREESFPRNLTVLGTEFASSFALVVTHSFFYKRFRLLITFRSGNNQIQIDFMLVLDRLHL